MLSLFGHLPKTQYRGTINGKLQTPKTREKKKTNFLKKESKKRKRKRKRASRALFAR